MPTKKNVHTSINGGWGRIFKIQSCLSSHLYLVPLFTQKIKPQHFGSQKIKTWHFYVPHAQPVQTPCHVKIKPLCLKYIFVKIKPWCLKMYFFILTSTLSYFSLLVWRTPPGPWSRGSVFGHIDDSQFCFSVADMLNFSVRFGIFILNIRDKERYDPPGRLYTRSSERYGCHEKR